jgi:hypothetical protein
MLRPAVDTALKQETTSEVHDVPYTLPGGEVRKATVRVTLLRDALGGIIGLLGIAVPAEAVSGGKRR